MTDNFEAENAEYWARQLGGGQISGVDSIDARSRQVGGDHYGPANAVQPIDVILDNGIGFCEGSAIKYLCRWRKKGGVQDLHKAIHYIEMLIEHEEK